MDLLSKREIKQTKKQEKSKWNFRYQMAKKTLKHIKQLENDCHIPEQTSINEFLTNLFDALGSLRF